MEHVVTVREGASLNILFNQTSRNVCIGYPQSANLSREPDMDSLFEKGSKSKSFTHRPVHLPGLHHITPAANTKFNFKITFLHIYISVNLPGLENPVNSTVQFEVRGIGGSSAESVLNDDN